MLPTINFDPDSPLHIQAYPGHLGFSVATIQKDPAADRYLLVSSYSRLWTAKDKLLPPLMLELTAITEGLLELRHITAFAPHLVIPCSDGLRKLAAKPTTHHPVAAGLLLDFLLFKPDLKATAVQFSPDLAWHGTSAW